MAAVSSAGCLCRTWPPPPRAACAGSRCAGHQLCHVSLVECDTCPRAAPRAWPPSTTWRSAPPSPPCTSPWTRPPGCTTSVWWRGSSGATCTVLSSTVLYCTVLYRCHLLARVNPQAWARVRLLCDNLEARRHSSIYSLNQRFLLQALEDIGVEPGLIGEEEVQRLAGLLDSNTFEVPTWWKIFESFKNM